jgi:hypothetical protein|tara:strand:+ start:653 stop:922 length:270 start_codon:yes stop_codon:yes gene_type:complete
MTTETKQVKVSKTKEVAPSVFGISLNKQGQRAVEQVKAVSYFLTSQSSKYSARVEPNSDLHYLGLSGNNQSKVLNAVSVAVMKKELSEK